LYPTVYKSPKGTRRNSRPAGRAGLVENMPGFVRLEVLRPIKSDYYNVVTHWENVGAFEKWTESPEFKEAHKKRPPSEIFSGPNVFEMHEVIEEALKKG
jgi:heme oxygenase (mycobilin-producing)